MDTSSEIEYAYTPNSEISMRFRGFDLWRYRFATDHEKPYVHPLCTPSGIILTCFEPWDYHWHRGLWFSWQYINGADYWEERDGVPPGRGEGHLRFVGPETVSVNGKRVKLVSRYEYVPPEGGVVMEGLRTLRFHAPRNGAYPIDWSLAYHARTNLVISRDPEAASGYSGLSVRMARTMGNFKILNSEGYEDDATLHSPARWVDISGTSDGGWDLTGGLTLMEHPENLRAPNLWKTSGLDHYGFVNPSPVLEEPIRLDIGDGFTLRYRVLVHDGMLSGEQIEEEFMSYAALTH